jgi:hypothetical protein
MAYELRQAYPLIQTRVQLIQGLPGQTPKSWRATLAEVARHDLVLQPFLHSLLPSSPAYLNKSYTEKWKPVYSDSVRYSSDHKFFRGTFLASCATFSKDDMVEMSVITNFYVTLTQFKFYYPHINFEYEKIVDAFCKSKFYKGLKENLHTNWNERDSYYFTVDIDLNPKIYSACEYSYVAHKWGHSNNLKKLVLDNVDRLERRKFFKNEILAPLVNVMEY